MPDVPMTGVRVSWPVKRRLDALQAEAIAQLGRPVTLNEVLEVLISEHDKAMEANPI